MLFLVWFKFAPKLVDCTWNVLRVAYCVVRKNYLTRNTKHEIRIEM